MISGLSADEQRDLILSVGTHNAQRRLSPAQVSDLLTKAHRSGTSTSQLAERLRLRDTSVLNRLMRLQELPPAARDLVGWGRAKNTLSMTVAAEIASAPSSEREQLVAAAAAHQLTKTETRSIVQRMRITGESLELALESVLEERQQIERRYVLIGSITSAELRRNLAGLDHEERQNLFRRVIATLELEGAEGSLRPSGFSLAREDKPFTDPDGLEMAISARLKRELE